MHQMQSERESIKMVSACNSTHVTSPAGASQEQYGHPYKWMTSVLVCKNGGEEAVSWPSETRRERASSIWPVPHETWEKSGTE